MVSDVTPESTGVATWQSAKKTVLSALPGANEKRQQTTVAATHATRRMNDSPWRIESRFENALHQGTTAGPVDVTDAPGRCVRREGGVKLVADGVYADAESYTRSEVSETSSARSGYPDRSPVRRVEPGAGSNSHGFFIQGILKARLKSAESATCWFVALFFLRVRRVVAAAPERCEHPGG
jgi:hypothetical protein